jgi:hypothetical protein
MSERVYDDVKVPLSPLLRCLQRVDWRADEHGIPF